MLFEILSRFIIYSVINIIIVKKYRIFIRFKNIIKKFLLEEELKVEAPVFEMEPSEVTPKNFRELYNIKDQFKNWLTLNDITSMSKYSDWYNRQPKIKAYVIAEISGNKYYLPSADNWGKFRDSIAIELKNMIMPLVGITMDQNQVFEFLDELSESNTYKEFFADKKLTAKTLNLFFKQNYPLLSVRSSITNTQAKAVDLGVVYLWPTDFELRVRSSGLEETKRYVNLWINKQNNISTYEKLEYLYDQPLEIIEKVFTEIINKVKSSGLPTNYQNVESFISGLEKGKLNNQKATSIYKTNDNKIYSIGSLRDFSRKDYDLYSEVLKLFEPGHVEERGAKSHVRNNLDDLKIEFPGVRFEQEFPLGSDDNFRNFINSFDPYKDRLGHIKIDPRKVIEILGLKNFRLSTVGEFEDNFELSKNENDTYNLRIKAPHKKDEKILSNLSFERAISPLRYRIDLLVITASGKKIAYEFDGDYHYGLSSQNRNMLNDFLNDQIESYYLRNIGGYEVVRIPVKPIIGNKNYYNRLIEFVRNDLKSRIN